MFSALFEKQRSYELSRTVKCEYKVIVSVVKDSYSNLIGAVENAVKFYKTYHRNLTEFSKFYYQKINLHAGPQHIKGFSSLKRVIVEKTKYRRNFTIPTKCCICSYKVKLFCYFICYSGNLRLKNF